MVEDEQTPAALDHGQQRSLEKLLSSDDVARVEAYFGAVVRMSFLQDARRRQSSLIMMPSGTQRITRSEINHRVKICIDWFFILRGDMHYSIMKAMDILPLALRNELDGVKWEPPLASAGWAPQTGNDR